MKKLYYVKKYRYKKMNYQKFFEIKEIIIKNLKNKSSSQTLKFFKILSINLPCFEKELLVFR
jgi:hypothetical protein